MPVPSNAAPPAEPSKGDASIDAAARAAASAAPGGGEAPAAKPELTMPEGYSDPFAELEAISAPPKPPAESEGDGEGEGDGDGEGIDTSLEALIPGEQKPPAEGEPSTKPKKKGSISELRTAYDNAKRELAELTKKIETKADPEPFQKQIDELNKEKSELVEKISFLDYTQNPDYQKQYEKPLVDAYKSAYAAMQELTVTEEDGSERQATPEDFNRLLTVNRKEASKFAHAWFAEAAPDVIALRNKVLEQTKSREEASKSFRENIAKRREEQQQQMAVNHRRQQELWKATLTKTEERLPQFFKPDDKDPEGTKLLEKGLRAYDAAIDPSAPFTPEQRITLSAALRFKAGAFDRVVTQLKNAETQVSELKKKLAVLEDSEPSGASHGAAAGEGGKTETWSDDWDKTFAGKR
jgi:hypothetical protein